MPEIKVIINKKKIKDRYNELNNMSDQLVIPVIKNNANGLGFNEILNIYKDLGVNHIAAAYANEWYTKAKEDDGYTKIAWLWEPNEKYKEVKNLELVCKTFKQLEWCVANDIPAHIEIDVAMNRGGFSLEFLSTVKRIVGDTPIGVMTHCPYEDRRIADYIKLANNAFESVKKTGINVKFFHSENSAVFRYKEIHGIQHDGARLGEALLIPQTDCFGEYSPMKARTYVLAKKSLKTGDNYGYTHGSATKSTNIIIIPVGYYNFYNLKNVEVLTDNGLKICPVIAMMHDTSIVDLGENKHIDDSFITILNYRLWDHYKNSWRPEICIQKYFRFNPDMVDYEYKN